MNKKQKKVLIRIVISAVMLVVLHFIPASVLPLSGFPEGLPRMILYLAAYLVIGYDILKKSVRYSMKIS